MDQHDGGTPPGGQDREILDILLESDLYLELPLKERQALFKHIVSVYLCSPPPPTGHC